MLFWDPDPVAFTLPVLGRPIMWYGVLFAFGFFVAYHIAKGFAERDFGKGRGKLFVDKLFSHVFVGTLVGARLGHVLFYENWLWTAPLKVFAIWEGGLASHGAVVGILLALFVFYKRFGKRYDMSFWGVIDLTVIPIAVAAVFIRLGNFVNQEIVGTVTSKPWGVVFGHPVGFQGLFPRHPVQLYEALAYLATFCILWPKRGLRGSGRLTGLFFLLVFGSRFCLEFLKEGQGIYDQGLLMMGHYLSIPLILLGLYLFRPTQIKTQA